MYIQKYITNSSISLKLNTEILNLVSEFYALNFEGRLIWDTKVKIG
jgi:dTDP-4-dehydrorhamnose 3,5-epimerase-like enzyme